MKRLVLVCGILASVVSVSMGAMSDEEWNRAKYNCIVNKDKNACEALINNGLVGVEHCNGGNYCAAVGGVYYKAERYREAIPYFEKAIALGDMESAYRMGDTYYELQDYYNAKKYYEIGCNKGNGNVVQATSCLISGRMYYVGKDVRQDYHKAYELLTKACDMKEDFACYTLGEMYFKGLGVGRNLSIARQYFGKACDLGSQLGCRLQEIKSISTGGVE